MTSSVYRSGLRLCISVSVFLCALFSCEDTTNSSNDIEGCEAISDSCPTGTSCRLDPLGNAYCAPVSDPPLTNAGTSMIAGEAISAGETIGGEENAGMSLGGSIVGGSEAGVVGAGESLAGENSGGENSAGQSSAGETPVMCGTFNTILKPTATSMPDVMLVVDRSYSMVNSEDRWTPALRAISQVTQALEAEVSFGLTLFPDPTSNAVDATELNQCQSWGRDLFSCEEDVSACAPGRVLVEPTLNNSLAVRENLNTYPPLPNQATPTYSALQVAAQALINQPNQGNQKVIILVTDGMPGCNFRLMPTSCTCLTTAPFFCEFDQFAGMCLDDDRTIEEVTRLAGLGIKTIVVGMTLGLPSEGPCIGDNECPYGGQACVNNRCVNLAPSVLSEMARSGGDPNGQYFSIANLDDIESQITLATASIAPCVFDISEIPVELYEHLIVYLDGAAVERDESRMSGWWADRGVLEFYGAACDSIRDGMSHRIAARCE